MKKYFVKRALAPLLIGLLTFAHVEAATVVVNSDVIGSGYTYFNGFEGFGDTLPNATTYVLAPSTYTEDSIKVSQIGQALKDYILTSYAPSSGTYDWYPHAGDFGYTQIGLVGGSEISALSLQTINGWLAYTGDVYLNYSLLNNGVLVLSGSVQQLWGPTPISFTGGGFNEVLLSATCIGKVTHLCDDVPNDLQALGIDDIKVAVTAVPEPETYAMLLAGLGLLGFMGRRRKLQTA